MTLCENCGHEMRPYPGSIDRAPYPSPGGWVRWHWMNGRWMRLFEAIPGRSAEEQRAFLQRWADEHPGEHFMARPADREPARTPLFDEIERNAQ